MPSRRTPSPPALILLAFLGLAVLLAFLRPLDGDEGYYAGAAGLVAAGKIPYADFFYPQTPLLPYLYAPWARLAPGSFLVLRLFSVAAAALGLWLWGAYLRREYRDRAWLAATGMLLVSLDPHFLSWNVTVKTYALANLAVFACLGALRRGWDTRSGRWFALAGLAAGLAVGVRLLYAAWAGILLLGVLVHEVRGERRDRGAAPLLGFGLGLAAGLAPVFVFLLRDPDRFLFNNLRYHTLRYSALDAIGAGAAERAGAAFQVLLRTLAGNPFLLVLVGLAAWGWWVGRRWAAPGGRTLLNLWAAGFLAHTLASLLPDPVYAQYFTAAWTPLLAPLAVAGLGDLAGRSPRPRLALIWAVVCAAGFTGVELGLRGTGMDDSEVWSRGHQERVAAAIAERSGPDDVVLAFWSGYPFSAARVHLPGMENHFGLGVTEQLDLDRQLHYRLAGKEYLLEALIKRVPAVVVLGAWMHEINTRLDQNDLPVLLEELDRNYEIDAVFGEVKVLTRRERPPPP